SKVFQGEYFNETLNEIKKAFIFCKAHAPKAKRARSSEIYIIGKGYQT
ncbi:MAG: SAM-dependent methyltransferase, partial [Candidatus Thermoplasmatota archaeon]